MYGMPVIYNTYCINWGRELVMLKQRMKKLDSMITL